MFEIDLNSFIFKSKNGAGVITAQCALKYENVENYLIDDGDNN